jgi:hypothetical protein
MELGVPASRFHTSHPAYSLYRQAFSSGDGTGATALSVLLALDHVKRIGAVLTEQDCSAIAADGWLDAEGVRYLHEHVDGIHLYRRSHLPAACYRCGETRFDYRRMRCRCGVELFGEADSMSVVLRKRP